MNIVLFTPLLRGSLAAAAVVLIVLTKMITG